MQVRSIVLYNARGDIREIPFKTGAVNIVTGRSLTGKSALIDIIDYCLGRSTFSVPEGVIRDTVAWYAVIFSLESGTEALIAKPTPKENANSQSQAYLEIGVKLAPPPLSKLVPNTNDEGINTELSARIGVEANLHTPPAGQSRDPIEATLKHTVYYLFQPQSLVANKDLLFYRQSEPFLPQTIKDTLPYFLGVENRGRVALENELRIARRKLKLLQRDLDEARAIATDQLTRGKSLITESQQVGILPATVEAETSEQVLSSLRPVLQWKPSVSPTPERSKTIELRTRVNRAHEDLRAIYRQIEAAEVFQTDTVAYETEAGQQVLRLQSIGLFNEQPDSLRCPVCSTDLSDEVPNVATMRKSLETLTNDLAQVEAKRPQLREYIDSLRAKQEEARERLIQEQFSLSAAVSEEDEGDALRDANARAARVVGRVSLYLESLHQISEDEELGAAVRNAAADVARLEAVFEAEDPDQTLLSILNRIAANMTQWAGPLQLEHPGPYRFDYSHLTVVADRPGRPIPMERMGGGKNWLGCHLLALLALHTHFIDAQRPVPGFLVLDQPTQVYFPSQQSYADLSGTTEETSKADADLDAVRRMFDLLFKVCEDLKGQLQVIVMEHANLPDEKYQSALVEQPWSGTGSHALVPENWKHIPISGEQGMG